VTKQKLFLFFMRYCTVTYPSIGNFTWSKKIHTTWGQKGENKPLELKNGTKAPKNQK
jgi:hypothetical protein